MLALGMLAAGLASAADDEPWREVLDKDGIRVSQRLSSGRSMPEFRSVAEIPASRWHVLAVVVDVPNQPRWMHRLSEASVLHAEAPFSAIFYLRMDLPWPISDRDVVVESDTGFPGEDVSLTRFARTTHADRKPVEGVVRMPRLRGHYRLTALAPERTRVEYQVDADPGGNLPRWLVTRISRDDPWYTLKDLRERVAATRGEYTDFVRRWDPSRAPER
jgi:hypothetical protein